METCVLRTTLVALLLTGWWSSFRLFALERLEPADGCYLGIDLGATDTIAGLAERLGITPAVFVRFFDFPMSTSDRGELTNFLNEVLANGGIAMITLEPSLGLDSVSQTVCVDLGTLCAAYEQRGIDGIIIRFGHEMNGNWYAWGQQPILYKQKFRLLAQTVHSRTTRTAMLWAPNYGVGYPFGAPRAVSGTADFAALDTDGDGMISSNDDMYEPYYPGDDVVDWVGMTLYHWGVTYPWFENELPLPKSFAGSLAGTYQGTTPNFYARYCVDGVHNKPMAIPETSAFYNTEQPGPGEFNLKQAWWQQVFNISGDSATALDVAQNFPKLKCIAWFDQYKQESEAKNNWIDWRISADERIRAAFVNDVRKLRNGRPYFLTAQEAHWQQFAYAITASSLPRILPLSGSISVSLNAKAQTPCDMVIDLLDADFQWQGGTRVSITALTQAVNTSFSLVKELHDGGQYRWSIFLTPPGGSYQQALSWYKGTQPVARVVHPAIDISSFPPLFTPGSNFNVRVKYVAPERGVAIVNLLDNASHRVGGGSVTVLQGDGHVDVSLELPAQVDEGNYWLEAILANSSSNLQSPLAHSVRLPLLVKSSVDLDLVNVTVEPSLISAGEVFRFEVGYAATTNRDLHIDLFDAGTNYVAISVQPVSSGSGVCDMTISFPKATPGDYFISAYMTPGGQPLDQAVAWSNERHLTVMSIAYKQWIESQWGILLQNDPVRPQDDPDGDGASNADEFRTQTDPRNALSILKLSLARAETGLVVSWPSVAGHSYQLLESASPVGDSWLPVGGPLVGTGAPLEVAFKPSWDPAYYRVQLLP